MSLLKPSQLHLKDPVYVADILKEVIERTASYSGFNILYIHDRPEQIGLRLLNKKTQIKYPAIMVYHDFPETLGNDYYADVVFPKIVIVTDTKKEIFSDDRYERTFKPILYPIYGWFIKCLALHPSIVQSSPENIKAVKWDRLYWGTKTIGTGLEDGGQALTDYTDAIELQNLRLTFQQNC